MPITRQQRDGEPETPLPRFLQIEPVGQCNLRCRMCSLPYRTSGESPRPAFLDQDAFRKLIDQFSGAERLHLQGLGEPLMHPQFFDMVSYAVSSGLEVSTNSNLTLLDIQQAEKCVQSGLSWIGVSLDGATAGTYESIRIGARFSKVLSNIGLLRETKKQLSSRTPGLRLIMVIMKRNMHELEALVRLAHSFAMDKVFVQHLCHDFGEETLPGQYESMREFVKAESLLGENPLRVQEHFQKARAAAHELNMELRLPRVGNGVHVSGKTGRERCDWPWTSSYISCDGSAMPCCTIGTPDRMNFGNMVGLGVRPIWESEGYRAFRAQLDSGSPPSICRSCSVYRGIF